MALPLAFLGGLAAGVNPCCLALYPMAAGTCCTAEVKEISTSLRRAVAFIIGIAAATSVLGVVAALAGRTLQSAGRWPLVAIAAIPIAMGLQLIGAINLRLPQPRIGIRSTDASAFLIGLLVSLVLAPCGTPLLAAVLTYAAYDGSPHYGATLLFLYGLGMGLPLLIVGTAAGAAMLRFERSGMRKWIDRIIGALLIAFGFYLLWIA